MKFIILTFLIVINSFSSENIKNFLNHKHLIFDFNQNIINASNKKIEYEGKIYIKNDNKVYTKWDYVNPISKQIYLINNRTFIIEKELEQVIIINNKKNSFTIEDLIKDSKFINKKNNIEEYNYFYKERKINIKIFYNEKLNILNNIKYVDELENKTEIKFNNYQFLKSKEEILLLDKELTPKIKNNYDIIRR